MLSLARIPPARYEKRAGTEPATEGEKKNDRTGVRFRVEAALTRISAHLAPMIGVMTLDDSSYDML